jgi:two-component system sensor histidine kinase PilS (NtrC family)
MIRVNDFRSQGVGAILSFKDITQIKAMEERFRQVDRLALMGQMVAGFAHEVRNPLASISGSIQVLTDEIKGSESGERLLKIISREVNKLDTLLADFLTFARPAQTPVASFDLIELIHDTITLIKKNKKFPASIQWEVAVEPPLHLKIAKGEFSQVLWNLLINALQAVPDDGLIRIGARKQDTDPYRGWVEITVRDNGPGIPPNELAKVFEPFFTTKEKGTGLGLSVVQKIVSDHGGLIRVESPPGKGAEFILLFPGIEENRSGPVSA